MEGKVCATSTKWIRHRRRLISSIEVFFLMTKTDSLPVSHFELHCDDQFVLSRMGGLGSSGDLLFHFGRVKNWPCVLQGWPFSFNESYLSAASHTVRLGLQSSTSLKPKEVVIWGWITCIKFWKVLISFLFFAVFPPHSATDSLLIYQKQLKLHPIHPIMMHSGSAQTHTTNQRPECP